jgi:hypothetical protein
LDITTVQNTVTEIEQDAGTVLETIAAVDPAVAIPVATAEGIVSLVGGLITKALLAWSAASGTPITQASVLALLPDNTPLVAPTK